MSGVRAVLFDVDGTLLDSNDAQAHAWLDALRGHGISVPFDLVRSKIGASPASLLRDVAGVDPASSVGRSIAARRSSIFRAYYLPELAPFHGARTLVERVRARGLSCACITTASRDEAADLLRAAAVADVLPTCITPEDLEGTDHDLVTAALERLAVPAAETLLVADSAADVEAAARAGVSTIALRSGGARDSELKAALAIFDGPQDLASQLDRSPIVRGHAESSLQETAAGRARARRAAASGRPGR